LPASGRSAANLIDPTIAVHNGRVVKRTGDGSIIEFRRVVDAVRCAIRIQFSSLATRRGPAMGQVGRNEGCEFHRLAFVGRLSRNAPAVVEDPSHEKRELRPQVHGLFRRQAIAQDVQHRSQRPVGGPMITAGGYTTETAVSAIEPAPAHPGWGAAERLRRHRQVKCALS
jgi:hypothetical protein